MVSVLPVFTVSATPFLIIWGAALVVWMIISTILVYHWNSYGPRDSKIRAMRIIYFVGSFVLFASAATFIASF